MTVGGKRSNLGRLLSRSPSQYLLQQRVERAKQLLKRTDKPIVEIALACGFNSQRHLSRKFRHLTGMRPKAYRPQQKNPLSHVFFSDHSLCGHRA
nr:helix-turn-helix transcriptional regulator [Halomicronema sp. CCY15110]